MSQSGLGPTMRAGAIAGLTVAVAAPLVFSFGTEVGGALVNYEARVGGTAVAGVMGAAISLRAGIGLAF